MWGRNDINICLTIPVAVPFKEWDCGVSLVGLWVRIPPGSVVSVVRSQVEISTTG